MTAALAADPHAAAEAQLAAFTRELTSILGGNLVGLYLHGSLALGGFDPRRSDIDVLGVVHIAPTLAQQAALSQLLLNDSRNPCPIEISIITALDASLLRHPVPFVFHYSEAHREAYALGRTTLNQRNDHGDPDLVLHVLVARRRGRVLAGSPSATWLPNPARESVADSILRDLAWAQKLLSVEHTCPGAAHDDQKSGVQQNACYLRANALRALAWAHDDVVLSKQEGTQRAHRYLPAHLTEWVQRSDSGTGTINSNELTLLFDLATLAVGSVRAHATQPDRP